MSGETMAYGLDRNKKGVEQDGMPVYDGHREHVNQLEKLSKQLDEYFALRRF